MAEAACINKKSIRQWPRPQTNGFYMEVFVYKLAVFSFLGILISKFISVPFLFALMV
jgi:hypothetical protein